VNESSVESVQERNSAAIGSRPDRRARLSAKWNELMVKRVEGAAARSMVVEQDWTEELKRLVPRQ
jgi:hypothetical protein